MIMIEDLFLKLVLKILDEAILHYPKLLICVASFIQLSLFLVYDHGFGVYRGHVYLCCNIVRPPYCPISVTCQLRSSKMLYQPECLRIIGEVVQWLLCVLNPFFKFCF